MVRYLVTKKEGESAFIWAFTEEGVLETDVRLFYNRMDDVYRAEVTERVAQRTNAFTSSFFGDWLDNERGRTNTFHLGKVEL